MEKGEKIDCLYAIYLCLVEKVVINTYINGHNVFIYR